MNLNGGTLRFNTAAGLNRLNYTAGTIQLAGDRIIRSLIGIPSAFDLFGTTPVIPNGKGLIVEGDATIGAKLLVTGGTFSSQGTLRVGMGELGAATLRVENGGAAAVGGDMIISTSSGNPDPSVSGAGSTLIVGGSLDIRSSVVANRFRIDNQARAYISNSLILNQGTAVFLDGGTLRFDGYSNAGTMTYSAGTVQLAGNRVIGSDATTVELFGTTPVIGIGKALAVEQTATIASGLTINGGTFRANSVVVSGPLYFDHGILEITGGTITGLSSLAVPTNGEFRSRGVQGLRIVGAAGSTITATGNLTLGNASAVNGFGTQGTLQVGAHAVTLLDANDVVFDSLSLVTLGEGGVSGAIDAANGLTLDFGGNITGFGAVDTPNNPAAPLINNGHITGNSVAAPLTLTGYVKGVGTFDHVNFTGTFSPGLSPTSLQVGDISLSSTSSLVMEIGGTTAGSGYDQLVSSGALTLGGALQVSLRNGFAPTSGQSFNILDWDSVSGTFDTLQLQSPGANLMWNSSLLYTDGLLRVAVAGDYNFNGVVDPADYVVWRKTLGQIGGPLSADGNGNGQIDPGDLTVWRAHFGQTAGSGSGVSATVPEPATLMLLLFGAAGWSLRRRRAA